MSEEQMSDPFEALRGRGHEEIAPDIGSIKARAGKIVRRRRLVQSFGAVAVVLLALVGVLLRPQSNDQRDVAQPARKTNAPSVSTAPQALRAVATRPPAFDAAKGSTSEANTGAAAAKAPSGAQSSSMARSDSGGLVPSVRVEDLAQPHNVRFTLKVCNPGTRDASRQFNTGQRYDFDVSRGGKAIWRWSSGRSFAQMIGSETWKPHACKTWSEVWNGTDNDGMLVSTGSYDVVGTLATSPPLRSKPMTFCLDIC